MRLTSHFLAATLFAGTCFTFSLAATGQARDAEAQRLERTAMEADYLALDFASAEKKLNQALKLCANSGCSPAVHAKIHISLGIVLGGQGRNDAAKASFITGLNIDPTAEIDTDLATPELKVLFDAAKAELLDSLEVEEEVVLEEIAHTPPTESALHTPLPIFIMVPDDVDAHRVQLRYRAPGATDYKALNLSKLDIGYGGEIPCAELKDEGTLFYYVQVLDSTGAVVMTAGTRAQPFRVRIRGQIEGAPPSLPGQPPPQACAKPKSKAGEASDADKTIYPPCDSDRDCEEGMFCNREHRCEMRWDDEEEEEADPFETAKKSWVTVSFAMDIAHVSGVDVCTPESQRDSYYACYLSSGERYTGDPIRGRANDIQSGMALATMRALVGYDHLVHPNVTVGARLGYAFNGSPEDFLPIHADVRATYYFGSNPFSRAGVRPYVFLAGGLMQVDATVPVEVWEQTDDCQRPGGCKTELDAWKRAGNVFAGLGLGAQYAITPSLAMNLAVRGNFLFPASAAVISPEIGFTTGF